MRHKHIPDAWNDIIKAHREMKIHTTDLAKEFLKAQDKIKHQGTMIDSLENAQKANKRKLVELDNDNDKLQNLVLEMKKDYHWSIGNYYCSWSKLCSSLV